MTTLATSPKTLLTADDLARMPNARDYELIDGDLVERTPMGNEADWIATCLSSMLFSTLPSTHSSSATNNARCSGVGL